MIELSKTDFFWYARPRVNSPLYECLLGGIRETYWSENHLIRTLVKLSNGNLNKDIQNILSTQIENGKRQASRLENVLELLDESIEARKCEAMSGLCKESSEILEFTDEGSAMRDASIILVAERIVLYEASAYEGLIKIANTIGREDIASTLAESLLEEKLCSEALRALSEITLNNAHVAA
jgi:ferritin-like metal-binding protein YciE